ncbi:Solute carrier family 35 member SLC35F1/F2/F6 protein [Dioscorea alata]|uniref:Solute carrier family 35 member SLC35F1/F2/F6 protein n=1 Tax=Dioscorea alata TaxID=55571 RepID=A0ACB7UTC1_DIOAL|nr:Solute carrier family 35 member SLC35F1/F2/F6 protein [Dioscorea alata]
MATFDSFFSKRTLIGLALGQFVSLVITSTAFSSSELSRRVVKAYQYTSLTSVMLLDCWSIPSVILLTWLFLNTKYRFRKFVGVAVCVAGLVLVVFSDVHSRDRGRGSDPVKGDVLVLSGAMLYAVSNVSEVLPFLGYAIAMFLFYSTVPFVLKLSGSTMLNLSLLTSDMWAVLIRTFAYHEKVDWMYFIAFGLVGFGLVIYSGGAKEDHHGEAQAVEGIEIAERQKDEGECDGNT